MQKAKRYIIQDSDGDFLAAAGLCPAWITDRNRAKLYRQKELPSVIGDRELLVSDWNDPTTWEYLAMCGLKARPIEVKP